MMFYVGLHQPADASHFDRAFISIMLIRLGHANVEGY